MRKTSSSSFSLARSLSLGDCFESWAQPFLKKRGFSSSTLLTCWSAIVGPDLATHTAPLRIVKDRLELKVSPAFHLDAQYMSAQIIERVNTAMGGQIVKGIILKKGVIEKNNNHYEAPLYGQETLSPHDQSRVARLVKHAEISDLSCPKLEEALKELAAGVVGRKKTV